MPGEEQFCEKINNQQKRDRKWQGVGGGGIPFIHLCSKKDSDKERTEEREVRRKLGNEPWGCVS